MTYEDADSVRIMVDHIYDRDLNLGTKNIDQLTTLYMLADMKQIPTLTATVIQTLESRDFDLSDGDTTVSLAKALSTIYSVQMTNTDAFKSCLLTIAASRPSDFLKHPDLVILAADNPQIRQDLCTKMSSLVEIVHLHTCHSCGRIVDGHAPQKDAYAINVYRDNCKHCKRPVTPTRIEEFQVECKPKKYFRKPTVRYIAFDQHCRTRMLTLEQCGGRRGGSESGLAEVATLVLGKPSHVVWTALPDASHANAFSPLSATAGSSTAYTAHHRVSP